MRTSLRRTLCATAIAGGFTILGFALATSPASAETPDTTSGAHGLASGNQTEAATKAPTRTSGNQVTVIGDRNENNGSTRNGSSGSAGGSGQSTTGEGGNGSGNQTDADASAPVDASDNQVTVIGDGNNNSRSSRTTGSASGSNGDTTSGQGGNGSGNQTDADAKAPVDATGNQVTVIGDGNHNASESSNDGGSGDTGGDTTNGQSGNGSGNQTSPTATAPLNATGNQLTVIGDGNRAESTNDTRATNGSEGDTTDGQGGTGSGNQTTPNASAPVATSGNQVTIIGDGNTTGGTDHVDGGSDPVEPGADPNGPGDSTSPPLGDSVNDDTSGGSTSAATASGLQAGPIALVAGSLPQTGVAAGMLLWAGFGLAMLLLGLVMVASQRRGPATRRRGAKVAPVM